MAKTDRTVLISNDQQFGQVADPNKLEAMITHSFDKIDENDNEMIAHKKEVNPSDGDTARDKHVSNNDLKGLQDQITTNLNDLTTHKKQVDPTSSDTTRDKHVANNDLKVLQDQITTNDTASNSRDNTHKSASVIDHPDQSVTTEKIKDLAVTSGKIATGAVGRNQLDPILFEQTANASKFQEIDAQLADNAKKTNSFDDKHRFVFGTEYLSSFHKKIMANTATKIVFSGDSTTKGDATTTGFKLNELLSEFVNNSGFYNITTVNNGQSGKHTGQWETTYVTNDISANPDVLILRWGINDPSVFKDGTIAPENAPDDNRRDENDFRNSLRNGLTAVRNSKSLANLSIILMSPNSTNDTPNRRDQAWHEKINPIIKEAARDFNCCFIDTYSMTKDSIDGGDWMDDPYGDGRHIHPTNVANLWIMSTIYEVLFPYAIRNKYGASNVSVVSGGVLQKSVTDLPNTYKTGVSIHRTTNTGYPYNGAVVTFKNDNILFQINYPYQGNKTIYSIRIGFHTNDLATNSWFPWNMVGVETITPVSTFQSGWTNYNTSTHEQAGYWKDGVTCHLAGLIKGGTTTDGLIFNLPVGYRPLTNIFRVAACQGGSAVICITTTGDVFCTLAGSNTYLSLGGIYFRTA